MNDDAPWRDLDQYVANPSSRTVTVTLAPQTALRIDRVSDSQVSNHESFRFSELSIRGPYGTMLLQGEQLRKSFTPESDSKSVYSITYK
jgi:hypothetical protein